jgi:hypothetical protein
MAELTIAPNVAVNDLQHPPNGCVVCGARAEDQFIVYEKWGYNIRKCRQCGLGMTLLDRAIELTALYDETYFQGQRRDGYADYIGSENILRKEFRHSLDDLRRFGAKQGHLLEIGSAYGFFLAEASQYFDCMGIEVSEAGVEFSQSRGFNVQHGTLNADLIAKQEPFDAVVMLDVIEHLSNPTETLDLIWDALAMHGSVMISTGDWDSILARWQGKQWRLMTPPQHLFFYSVKTLTRLLENHGFEVVYLVKPWKTVSVGLMAYQFGNRLGLRLPFLESINIGLPVNLFDALRLVARKIPR